MDNNKCSYILFQQILEKKLLFMTMFIVAVSMTIIPLTMVPSPVDAVPQLIPQLTNCKTIDDKSNAECKQLKDKTEDSFDNCYTRSTTPVADNCKINQKVAVSNNFVNSETEAKIYQEVNSLVDCDYGASYCLATTFNDATQDVNVKTYTEGTKKGAIDFNVDQQLTQKIATDGQDRYVSKNKATQNFFATAIPSTGATSTNTATIDAEGSGTHIDMYATQENDECDDSTCTNTGTQTYDLQANGRSSIDVASDQGLQLYQTNNGCDDDDSGTVTIDCINDSSQIVRLISGAPNSNDDASIKFDTLDNMVVDQYNNCDFGQYDCKNTAQTSVNAFATGISSMKIDNVEQDVYQTSNCEDLNTAIRVDNQPTTLGCENFASVSLVSNSASDGKINVPEGEQTANQQNDCYDASCKNEVTLFAGLGQSFFTGPDPVEGTLTADYSQVVDQTNACKGDSACENEALVVYQAFANDDATVTSKSDQTVTQINECGEYYAQACLNSAFVVNHVYAEDTATVDSTVSQNLYQSCDSNDGPTCMNSNTLAVSGSAIDNSFLKYVASQSVTNNDGANNGETALTYQTDSNPATTAPPSLTSYYNQPPNTSVTNPPSNYNPNP